MKIFITLCCLLISSVSMAGGQHYITYSPWETDSVLVAWLIKNYVDKQAVFSAVPKGDEIPKEFAINTPNSPFRRNARFTAFDAAVRIHEVKEECVLKIQPIIRLLEMAPWRKHEDIEALHFEQDIVPLLPEDPGTGGLEEAFAFIDNFCASGEENKPITSAAPDEDLAFLALVQNDWKVIALQHGEFKTIATEQEPHTFDHDFHNAQTVYVGADKSVRLVTAGKERMLLQADQHAFTQPSFVPGGQSVLLVKLVDGSSTNTNIVNLQPETQTTKTLVFQHSTQLDPFTLNSSELYYSNISCVEGCGKIIQEIWHKNLIAQTAEQLTLLNAIAHQPSVDQRGEWLYFSSNKKGNYHIWRLSLINDTYEQLTEGDVTDSYPGVSRTGAVYFLRTVNNATSLLKREPDGVMTLIDLPPEYQKIRELKVLK